MLEKTKLIDKKILMELHPALSNKWTVEWLIRTRQIPIVRIGRRVYFDEVEIEKWIKKRKVGEQ